MPKIIENPTQIILDHAKKILFEEGYQGLSIRKVAKHCDISVGTIYNYFPTKRDIISQIMINYWENFLKEVDTIESSDAVFFDKLKRIYTQLEVFINVFHEVWLKTNVATHPSGIEKELRKRRVHTELLIHRIADILSREVKVKAADGDSPLTVQNIAEFVVLNFFTMTLLKQFEYDSFERVLRSLVE